MYDTLVRLWTQNKLTDAMLDKAVTVYKWITPEQKEEIMAMPKSV